MGRNNEFQAGVQSKHIGTKVYRGLNAYDLESEPNLDKPVGVHWTTSKQIAARFGVGLHPDDNEIMFGDEENTGHVLEGVLPKGQRETDPEKLAHYDLGADYEKEIPVKRGGIVHVHAIHKTVYDPETQLPKIVHTRKIDPPWTVFA